MTERTAIAVLAIHPNRRGFGWVALEGPFSPHDWGTVCLTRDCHSGSLQRVAKLLDRLNPQTVVCEELEPSARARAARLVRAVAALAAERSIEFAPYDRTQIKSCFRTVGAKTRQEIAEQVGRSLPALADLVPSPRKAWQKERHHMALFSAAAVGLVHFQLDAGRLLETL